MQGIQQELQQQRELVALLETKLCLQEEQQRLTESKLRNEINLVKQMFLQEIDKDVLLQQ